MDLDCDSPFSPGSASDLSDMFEPPTSSPPPSSLPKISLPISSSAKQSKSFKKKPSDSRAWQSIIGESDKGGKLARKLANSGKALNYKMSGWYYEDVPLLVLTADVCIALHCTLMFSPGAAAKKAVNMKVIDDKLKIIDDVPSSAVEMAVKEKVTAFFNC